MALTTTMVLGCSSSDQDSGGNGSSVTGVRLSGSVVDGYLSGAAVWVDIINNGQLDTSEPFAITNKTGGIGTAENGKSCANADVYLKQRDPDYASCLLGNFEPGQIYTAKARKGFDTYTNQPFEGTVEVKFLVTADGSITKTDGTPFSIVISPLTTITSGMTAAEKTAFAEQLFGTGADSNDLDQNYMTLVESADDVGKTQADKDKAMTIFRTAQTIVSAIASMEDEVKKQMKSLDSTLKESDIPSGASSMVTTLLAQSALSGKSIVDTLKDSASLAAAVTSSTNAVIGTINKNKKAADKAILSTSQLTANLATLDVSKTVASVTQTDAIFAAVAPGTAVSVKSAIKSGTNGMQTVRAILNTGTNQAEAIIAANTYTQIIQTAVTNNDTTTLEQLKSDQSDTDAMADDMLAQVKTLCGNACDKDTVLGAADVTTMTTAVSNTLKQGLSRPKMAPLVVFPVNIGALNEYLNGLGVDYIRDSSQRVSRCQTPGYQTEFVLRDTNLGVLCLADAASPSAGTISLSLVSGEVDPDTGTSTILFNAHVNDGSGALVTLPLRDERLLAGASLYAKETDTAKPNDYAGFYFQGAASALEGALTFCGTRTEDGDTLPKYENYKLAGRWFYHNDYTLELKLQLPGGISESLIISSTGTTNGTWNLAFKNTSNGDKYTMSATKPTGQNDFFTRTSDGSSPFIVIGTDGKTSCRTPS